MLTYATFWETQESVCHSCKESDDHAKGLATSSANPGKILARFWNVVGEEEKEEDLERRERTEAYTYIYCHFYIHIYIYPNCSLMCPPRIFPFSLGLFIVISMWSFVREHLGGWRALGLTKLVMQYYPCPPQDPGDNPKKNIKKIRQL